MFISFLYMFRATMSFIPPCIPDSHLYRVTNTRCRIGTVFSPDDAHIVARNMQRKTINILRKFVHQVGSIYKRFFGSVLTVQPGWYFSRFISSPKYATTATTLPYAILQCPFHHVHQHCNSVLKNACIRRKACTSFRAKGHNTWDTCIMNLTFICPCIVI